MLSLSSEKKAQRGREVGNRFTTHFDKKRFLTCSLENPPRQGGHCAPVGSVRLTLIGADRR